jgi:hypothetical protein
MSWCQAIIWDPRHRFSLLSDSCGFVAVGRPLWQRDGSVFYNCCWPPPAQPYFSPMKSSGQFASWFLYNFYNGHHSVFFWLGPIELCQDLLKYSCDYYEHVVQKRTVCIRSLNWLNYYLLVVPQEKRGTYFFYCGRAGLCNWGRLKLLLLLYVAA